MTPGVSLTFHFQCLFELFYNVHIIVVHIVFDLIWVYLFYVQRLFYLLKMAAESDVEPKEKLVRAL